MDRALSPSVQRRRRLRVALWWLAPVAAAALGIAWLPEWLRPGIDAGRVRIALVDRGPVEAVVEATGIVVPASERIVTSPVQTRVLRVLERPGAAVAVGDPLVELDTSAPRLELERLEERLARKSNETRRRDLALDRQLDDLRSSRAALELDRQLAEEHLRRERRLHADGLTSAESLRLAEVELQKTELELARTDREIASARLTAEAELEALWLEIGTYRAEVADARRRLERATARADLGGVLTWIVDREGASVDRGGVIARIADLGSFRIEARVSDAHAARIATGDPVRVRAAAAWLAGRVTTLRPTIEDGVLRFDVALDDPAAPQLRHNLRVDVRVVTDVREDVLRVAKGPFARGGAEQFVFVVDGDHARRARAELGVAGLEHWEIVSGLGLGDRVIVSNMDDYAHLERLRLH